jgi:hypothetical protein
MYMGRARGDTGVRKLQTCLSTVVDVLALVDSLTRANYRTRERAKPNFAETDLLHAILKTLRTDV